MNRAKEEYEKLKTKYNERRIEITKLISQIQEFEVIQ